MKAVDRSKVFQIDYRRIGRNIMQVRDKKDLRQEDMAEKLGISLTHYSNCERGDRKFALEYLFAICQILDMPFEQMLDGAISGICIVDDAENDDQDTIGKWLMEMRYLQYGCSDEAREYMLTACRNLAALDKHEH